MTPRQQAIIEGRGSSTFFQISDIEAGLRIPEPISIYVDVGMKIEIFPSPRAQEEAQAWNFSKSQCPYKGGEFEIFPSPRDYTKAALQIFSSPKAHIVMGMPNPIY